MFAVKIRRHPETPTTAAHNPAFAQIGGFLLDEKHSPRADDQNCAKNVENEIEALHERDTETDHDSAHDEGADDSPNQDAVLRDGGHAKVLIDEDENKNVIDAERVLDDVAGQELESLVRSADFPDQEIEQERKKNPDSDAVGRCPDAELASSVFELNEIESHGEKNAGMERDPKPDARM